MAGETPLSTTIGKTPRRRRRQPKSSSVDKENFVEKNAGDFTERSSTESKSRSRPSRKESDLLSVEDTPVITLHSQSESSHSSAADFAIQRFREAQKNAPASDIWNQHSSLAECIVLASQQGSKSTKGILLLEEKSVEILNTCRKCLKEATSEGKDKYSCLYIAIHGLRAVCPLVTKQTSWDAALKLLYHAVTLSADLCTETKNNEKWDCAMLCFAAFQAMADNLTGHSMKNEGQKEFYLIPQCSSAHNFSESFPLPSTGRIEAASQKGSLPPKQIFKISIQSILAVGKILSLVTAPSSRTSDNGNFDLDQVWMEFGKDLGNSLRRNDKDAPFRNCLRTYRDVALPWITFFVRAEREESFEDALSYAKQIHRSLWDAAAQVDKYKSLTRDKGHEALELRKYAIFALLLHGKRGSPSAIRTMLRNKSFDYACSIAWKAAASCVQAHAMDTPIQPEGFLFDFHTSVGEALDMLAKGRGKDESCTAYSEYCSYRAIHLGVHKVGSDQNESECSRNDCIFASFEPRYVHRICMRDASSVTLAVIFQVQQLRQDIGDFVQQGVTSKYEDCHKEGYIHEDICNSVISRFRLIFFESKETPCFEVRFRCYKLLSSLSLHRVAFNLTKELEAEPNNYRRGSQLYVLFALAGRFTAECIAPLALDMARDASEEALSARKNQDQLLEVAVECYVRSTSLFDRLFVGTLDQANGDSKEETYSSLAFRTVDSLYELTMQLSNHQDGCPSLIQNLVEKVAKTLAGIGRRRLDAQEHHLALLPLIYSTDLFVRFSMIKESKSKDRRRHQIPVRFAHISSAFQSLGMLDNACIALLAAIRHETLDCLDDSDSHDFTFEPLQTISRYTNGILPIGCSNEKSVDSRAAFTSRLVSLYLERQKGTSSDSLPPQHLLMGSPCSLVEFLIKGVKAPSSVAQSALGSATLSEILEVALIGPGMRDEILLYDEKLAIAERLNVLLEAIVYLGTQIQRTSTYCNLLQEFNDIVEVAFSIIDGGFERHDKSVIAILKAALSVVASTSLISSTHLLDFRHGPVTFEGNRAEGLVFDRSYELARSSRDYLVGCADASQMEIYQVLSVVLLASIDAFCLQMSEAKSTADSDGGSSVLLPLLNEAVNRVCMFNEWSTCKREFLEELASNFSITLAKVEVNFVSKGDKIHSAEVANLALRLTGKSEIEEKLWHCAIIGSALMEVGLYRLAEEVLHTFELHSIDCLATSSDLKNVPKSIILEMEIKAVMLRLDAKTYTSEDDMKIVDHAETILGFLSDERGDSDLFVLWVRGTVNMALSDASDRRGDVASSLHYLRVSFRICQNALKLTGRLKREMRHPPANTTILPFLRVRFAQRRVDCLRQMALCFANLGDHRKSESHILSAIDLSQLQLPFLNCAKVKFCDILPPDCPVTRTIQQLDCYRMLLELKAYASAADVVSQDMVSRYTVPGIFPSYQDDTAHDLNQLHWNVEEILNLVSHGDILHQDLYAEQDNGYTLLYKSANEVAVKKMSDELQDSFLSSFLRSQSADKMNLQYFDTLSCHLKLREARLLMATAEFGEVGEKAASLCTEIAKSPYAPKLCRAWAFYYLGLAELKKSRRNGSLKSLWRNHSISGQSLDDFGGFAKEKGRCEKSLSNARSYFKQTLSTLDSAIELLARDAMRCLALVTGPEEDPNMVAYSCAVLVHTSIGSTSRQNVSRAYNPDSERLDIRDFFSALDVSFNNPAERNQKVSELFEKANCLLPPTWRFLAVCLCPTGEILLSSVAVSAPNDSRSHLKTEVACVFQRDKNLEVYKDLLVPLDDLIRRSQEQLRGLSESAAAENFRGIKAKRDWWNERQDFDDNLKSLLELAENKYFGVDSIKRLFVGGGGLNDENANDASCKSDSNSSFESNDSTGFSCGNLASKFEAACSIGTNGSPSNRQTAASERVSHGRKCLEQLKVPEIKEQLKSLDVEPSKMRKLRKSELIDLLISIKQTRFPPTKQKEQRKISHDESTRVVSQLKECNDCVFLVLDEHLHQFPFEGMSFLAERSVSRIPSLPFALAALVESDQPLLHDETYDKKAAPMVDPVGARFVVDPEANLTETNKRIVPVIQEIDSTNSWKWKGVVGAPPDLDFMEDSLTNQNGLFLYCGHGGGQSFFSRSQVDKLLYGEQIVASQDSEDNDSINKSLIVTNKRRCRSTVILMGCSSGKLESVNRKESKLPRRSPIFYEPEGIVISYLCAGAPCVVGNLWDVTDRDIDRYCLELLKSFLVSKRKKSLAQCVADARSACKMRYIVGCAPVCYGVPVLLKET